MNLSGIRPSQSFYDYNYIKLNELRSQQISAAAAQSQVAPASQEPVVGDSDSRPVEQNYTSFNYAKEYRPDETYDLVGADSDIHSLDLQKVMSDLEKDKVIRQYQYFVNDDGLSGFVAKEKDQSEVVLRSGENFML